MLTMLSSQAMSATLYRLADWLKPTATVAPVGIEIQRKSGNVTGFPRARAGGLNFGLPGAIRQLSNRPPLRVVRVLDPDTSRGSAGRIVISGCIADVCDELDRLAQNEASVF